MAMVQSGADRRPKIALTMARFPQLMECFSVVSTPPRLQGLSPSLASHSVKASNSCRTPGQIPRERTNIGSRFQVPAHRRRDDASHTGSAAASTRPRETSSASQWRLSSTRLFARRKSLPSSIMRSAPSSSICLRRGGPGSCHRPQTRRAPRVWMRGRQWGSRASQRTRSTPNRALPPRRHLLVEGVLRHRDGIEQIDRRQTPHRQVEVRVAVKSGAKRGAEPPHPIDRSPVLLQRRRNRLRQGFQGKGFFGPELPPVPSLGFAHMHGLGRISPGVIAAGSPSCCAAAPGPWQPS